MKPAWDKLMDAYADSPFALIADVDCKGEGKPLCTANAVRGYPSIKWGDPTALEDYKGGRDYDTLLEFAEENLKPMCSPSNIELCDLEKKAEIEKFQAMSPADLDADIKTKEKEMVDAEETYKFAVYELQEKYQALQEAKEATLASIKDSGLGSMKAVKAAGVQKGSDEL
jgi:hypothetical protein